MCKLLSKVALAICEKTDQIDQWEIAENWMKKYDSETDHVSKIYVSLEAKKQ